jgi:hypothetical protein
VKQEDGIGQGTIGMAVVRVLQHGHGLIGDCELGGCRKAASATRDGTDGDRRRDQRQGARPACTMRAEKNYLSAAVLSSPYWQWLANGIDELIASSR